MFAWRVAHKVAGSRSRDTADLGGWSPGPPARTAHSAALGRRDGPGRFRRGRRPVVSYPRTSNRRGRLEEVGMRTIGLAIMLVSAAGHPVARDGLDGRRAGEEWTVAGVRFCWCPPGKFTMGSPRGEPERRPGEDQVEVTLTTGFWAGKYEVTQGDWKRVVGKLPGD